MEQYVSNYSDYYNDYDQFNITPDYSQFVHLCENPQVTLFGAMFTPVLFSLTFIFSLIGNALVLWVLVRYERLRLTVTDIFILNLITSDLLFAFSLPFWAVDHTHGWIFGKAMCKIMSSIFFIGYYSGIMLLVLMTIDRYVAVVHSLFAVRIRKVSYAVTASLVIWGISISATIPEMIFSDITGYEEERLYCFSNYPPESTQIWQLLGCYQQNILFFFIPLVVIVFCYWRILNTVIRCKARKKHKTVKVIFCIVVVFFVCWTPYNVVIFLFSLVELEVPAFESCETRNRLIYALYISRDLAYCHCCLNPFFYAFVGTKFRNHLIRLLKICFPHLKICRELSTTTSTSTKQVNSRNCSDIDLPLASIGS
ncbi:C-C chemokine receptor type 4-like [Stegostoma tigrinum]|uniref:C-C chemokine receptor type 4-like n=1 Tax=Stegostoma tigrinum TaxID=3053191 RepID=UPI002870A852|nr:C-C chemokine receptor type 4-like [Stegostoma tigrinum]